MLFDWLVTGQGSERTRRLSLRQSSKLQNAIIYLELQLLISSRRSFHGAPFFYGPLRPARLPALARHRWPRPGGLAVVRQRFFGIFLAALPHPSCGDCPFPRCRSEPAKTERPNTPENRCRTTIAERMGG